MSDAPPGYHLAGPSQIFSQGVPASSQQHPSASQGKSSAQRCENCRSRRLFVQDGRLWCRRCGTLQEDFVQTQQDDDVAPLLSSQITKQKREAVEKVSKILPGIKGLYLYLSVYQLILQYLCRALIDSKGLPAAMEPLVKDLWELRMVLVRERYLATKPGDDEEDSDATVYSSQTETEYKQSENGETTDASGPEGRSYQIRKERDYPSIMDMLGLCYFSCMILRVPLSTGSLYRWATQEEIPFLQPLRLVPADMHHRLNQRWLRLLQTRAPLQPSKLYSSIHDLYTLYNRHFAITLPPLNYPPLLYQYVTALSLPIDLFPSVSQLSTILLGAFEFLRPRRRKTFFSLPEVNLVVFLAINIKLFHPFSVSPQVPPATLESHELKLGTLPLDWQVWMQAQRALSSQIEALSTSSATSMHPEKQVHITAEDVFSLNESEMDSYMDWYERTWTTTTPRQFSRNSSTLDENGEEISGGGIFAEIVKMFPPSRYQQTTAQANPSSEISSEEDKETKRRHLQEEAITFIQSNSFTSDQSSNHTENTLSGENYPHYRYLSDLGDADSPARIFHERLAEHAGLDLGDLLKAIYNTERKLINQWSKQRKRRASRNRDDNGDKSG